MTKGKLGRCRTRGSEDGRRLLVEREEEQCLTSVLLSDRDKDSK